MFYPTIPPFCFRNFATCCCSMPLALYVLFLSSPIGPLFRSHNALSLLVPVLAHQSLFFFLPNEECRHLFTPPFSPPDYLAGLCPFLLNLAQRVLRPHLLLRSPNFSNRYPSPSPLPLPRFVEDVNPSHPLFCTTKLKTIRASPAVPCLCFQSNHSFSPFFCFI